MRAFIAWLALLPAFASAQVSITGYVKISGTIESVSPGVVVVKDEGGKVHMFRIQDKEQDAVALTGGRVVRFPRAEVSVYGAMKPANLKPGAQLKFTAPLSRRGQVDGEVSQLLLVSGDDDKPGITVKKEGQGSDASICEVIGAFTTLIKRRLVVQIPPNSYTPRKALAVNLAEDASIRFASDDYRRAGAGAQVKRLVAAKISTGDLVIKELIVDATGGVATKSRVDDALQVKYRHLSDEPKPPRQIRSRHFVIMTDISDRNAQILLDKLETMVALLTGYFGRSPTSLIEGFVVRDLSGWSRDVLAEPEGVAKIRQGAGICFSRSLGRQRRATLYACDDHGVVQHEATHAFCHLAFGSTGPTWLAEGVAEMGQYWKHDQLAVDISPVVISYIQNATPKKTLAEIAVPGRTPAGGWRDYAWRWALCHLLAYNPNYSDRFKPLAIALMEEREGVSFASVYGPVARQISFEYDQFLQQLDNGYRADLCAWRWNAKFKPLQGDARFKSVIRAAYGWQPSGVQLQEGVSYDVAAVGKWAIAKDGSQVTAAGDAQGRGRLMGAIFHNFQLTEAFEIGQREQFVSPIDGQLFLRCQDDWNKLADNDGELTVHFRRTPRK